MMIVQVRAIVPALFVVFSFVCTQTNAVPAIVWSKSQHQQQQNVETISSPTTTSNEIPIGQLIESLQQSTNNNNLSILFLLSRDTATGNELVTSMTPLLQQTQQVQQVTSSSSSIELQQFLHVSGIESGTHVMNTIRKSTSNDESNSNPILINVNELLYKLNTTTPITESEEVINIEMDVSGGISKPVEPLVPVPLKTKKAVQASKRTRAIDNSNWLIVTLPHTIQSDVLDTTIVQTLHHPSVTTIVLTGVRSVDEVKYDREMKMRRQLLDKSIVNSSKKNQNQPSMDVYHRRLEQDNGGDNGGDGSNTDLSGVYYVQMTPNIFSGLLFFLLFTVVTMIGFSCMNMISGQDVYVHVMPSIGREA